MKASRPDSKYFRKFPFATVAALVLILSLEMGVWHFRYRFWDGNYILLEKKREMLTGNSEPDDIAIFGTSRFFHLRPDAIGEVYGPDTRVTNYAWSWSCLETYEAMLRGIIGSGRTPKIVLVDGIPEIFGYPQNYLTATDPNVPVWFYQTVPLMAGLRTEIGQKQWGVAWELMKHYITPPSSLYREKVYQGIKTIVSTGHLPPFSDYYPLVKEWQQRGWFLFVSPERVAGEAEIKAMEKDTGPYVLRKHEHIRYIYERFIRLAQKNNIKVILLPVANNALVFEAFTKGEVYAEYDKWLDHLEEKYSNFTAPGPRYFTWPGLLGDALHLNSAGVERHMKLVTDILSEQFKNSHSPPVGTSTNSE